MIVGTAGHIDHGKTTLVKALTGIDCDRLKEEKARGITLDLGYAYAPLPNGETLGFVDVPGHEKLVHNMLAGATGIDFALLVVAADDGPMPQTREHLEIVELLGIRLGAVALTKIDIVAVDRQKQAKTEIAEMLAGTALADAPVFPVCAASGEGLAALQAHLQAAAAALGQRPAAGGFRLAIDRCFTLSGAGTVVTGTAFSGQVRVGDMLTVSPLGKTVRVRSLRVQDTPAESGQAGQRIALALAGIEKAEVQRGQWVLAPALHAPIRRFDARLRVLAGQPALKHWTPVHLHLGAIDVPEKLVDERTAGMFAQVDTHPQYAPLGVTVGSKVTVRASLRPGYRFEKRNPLQFWIEKPNAQLGVDQIKVFANEEVGDATTALSFGFERRDFANAIANRTPVIVWARFTGDKKGELLDFDTTATPWLHGVVRFVEGPVR